MSFDPITLALAKNYTNEKVGNGGGSGGSSGGGLSVVTLTTLVPSEGAAVELSAEESAQMDAATQDGMPVYISVGLSLEGVEIARIGAVCVLLMTSEKTTAAVPAAGAQISVTKSSGETLWTVQLE